MLSKENDDADVFVVIVVLFIEPSIDKVPEDNVLLATDSEVKTININITIIIVTDADKYNEVADIGLLIIKAL
ncbi:MAG: hypothetical protein WA941_09065 [Nitrososphaeraceae archaeon]